MVGPFGINVAISANGHRAAKPEVASVAARQGLLRPVPYSTHCGPLRYRLKLGDDKGAELGSPYRMFSQPGGLWGLMPEPKIRLQVNVAVAAEAEGGRVGEGVQVAVCTGVVEQAF